MNGSAPEIHPQNRALRHLVVANKAERRGEQGIVAICILAGMFDNFVMIDCVRLLLMTEDHNEGHSSAHCLGMNGSNSENDEACCIARLQSQTHRLQVKSVRVTCQLEELDNHSEKFCMFHIPVSPNS